MGTKIIIEKYSTEWPLAFQNLKLCFEQVLGELVTAIHHIGSTSVDVLASRPIIDIDLEIKRKRT